MYRNESQNLGLNAEMPNLILIPKRKIKSKFVGIIIHRTETPKTKIALLFFWQAHFYSRQRNLWQRLRMRWNIYGGQWKPVEAAAERVVHEQTIHRAGQQEVVAQRRLQRGARASPEQRCGCGGRGVICWCGRGERRERGSRRVQRTDRVEQAAVTVAAGATGGGRCSNY